MTPTTATSSILRAVFFDFDGVILDSVSIKTRAFAAMFRSYGIDVERKVVAYHLDNGGISRFEKFRYYYETILATQISKKTLTELNQQFSEIIMAEILAAPFIKGALNCLEELQHRNIPTFVVSGVPDTELRMIVKKRRLADYFVEVHGSPKSKKSQISDIGLRWKLNLSECLMIGDALTDYEAADATGTMFLGIIKHNTASPFPANVRISSTVEIPRHLLTTPRQCMKEL